MTASTFEAAFRDEAITPLNAGFGVTVTISRQGDESDSFTARRSGRDYEVIGQDLGFPVKITGRDYLVNASDIDYGSGAREPIEGDRITEGAEVWEVKPLDGAPAVALKAGGFEYILHTQKVE